MMFLSMMFADVNRAAVNRQHQIADMPLVVPRLRRSVVKAGCKNAEKVLKFG
jgi:hypothetical protein